MFSTVIKVMYRANIHMSYQRSLGNKKKCCVPHKRLHGTVNVFTFHYVFKLQPFKKVTKKKTFGLMTAKVWVSVALMPIFVNDFLV